MVQVVYGTPNIPIEVQVEHLCVHGCRAAPFDETTGYTLGWWCKRPTKQEGLRRCDICETQFIDPNKYLDPKYDTNCPQCVIEYEIEEF